MGLIYLTGLTLLAAVAFKFFEHLRNPQILTRKRSHAFSTKGMMICVLALFPFWVNSFGQIEMDDTLQSVYFAIGFTTVVWSSIWHIWAKINIRFMWSDGIEIKKNHQLITTGAFALARHPMYASLLLWCLGASLMMFNWITLILVSAIILPLLIMRAKDEERELVEVQPDYVLYQQNVRMLTPTISSVSAVVIKVLAIVLLGYLLYVGVLLPSILLLFVIHLYLGYCLIPEKVAFSYRSKSAMMVVFWALSLLWSPVYSLLYIVLGMFIYGLKFNCPCMIVYNKFHRCPCFDFVEKCLLKK